jgi:hypothetical protein
MRTASAAALALALAVIPSVMAAQDNHRTFAGTSWGAGEDDTKAKISAAGFEFTQKDDDGDLNFDGEVSGYSSRVYAMLTPDGKLMKVTVLIATPDEEAIPTWRTMLTTMTKKYGEPAHLFETFKAPYKKGDGKAEEAIQEGKGTMAAFWGDEEEGFMMLEVTDKLAVRVAYESKFWPQESDRRTGKTSGGASSGGKAKRDPAASSPF